MAGCFLPPLLHGFAGGLGGAVNLAAHGLHVFSDSADGVAGGKAEGGERQKGEFDIHGKERLKAASYPASGSLSMRRAFSGRSVSAVVEDWKRSRKERCRAGELITMPPLRSGGNSAVKVGKLGYSVGRKAKPGTRRVSGSER